MTYVITSFIVYLLEEAKSVGSGKGRLELTPKDKTIEFKANEWSLHSCQCSIYAGVVPKVIS